MALDKEHGTTRTLNCSDGSSLEVFWGKVMFLKNSYKICQEKFAVKILEKHQ